MASTLTPKQRDTLTAIAMAGAAGLRIDAFPHRTLDSLVNRGHLTAGEDGMARITYDGFAALPADNQRAVHLAVRGALDPDLRPVLDEVASDPDADTNLGALNRALPGLTATQLDALAATGYARINDLADNNPLAPPSWRRIHLTAAGRIAAQPEHPHHFAGLRTIAGVQLGDLVNLTYRNNLGIQRRTGWVLTRKDDFGATFAGPRADTISPNTLSLADWTIEVIGHGHRRCTCPPEVIVGGHFPDCRLTVPDPEDAPLPPVFEAAIVMSVATKDGARVELEDEPRRTRTRAHTLEKLTEVARRYANILAVHNYRSPQVTVSCQCGCGLTATSGPGEDDQNGPPATLRQAYLVEREDVGEEWVTEESGRTTPFPRVDQGALDSIAETIAGNRRHARRTRVTVWHECTDLIGQVITDPWPAPPAAAPASPAGRSRPTAIDRRIRAAIGTPPPGNRASDRSRTARTATGAARA